MSGGSYNYEYARVEQSADDIETHTENLTPLRQRFADHLRLVAKAMHDIEWVDSYDYSLGREDEAIRKVLGE